MTSSLILVLNAQSIGPYRHSSVYTYCLNVTMLIDTVWIADNTHVTAFADRGCGRVAPAGGDSNCARAALPYRQVLTTNLHILSSNNQNTKYLPHSFQTIAIILYLHFFMQINLLFSYLFHSKQLCFYRWTCQN